MSTSPEAPHPSSLITDAHVQGALNNDKGPEAQLKSWNVKDFTKKGDNYASFVTRINVTYKNASAGKEEETSYIAKLNPLRDSEVWNLMTNLFFVHEGDFLANVVPVLNEFLTESKQDPLRIPACYLQDYTCGKEVLLNEDLGKYDYKMIDRKKGLDSAHLKLVIAEIARMNAAVQAYEEKHQIKIGEKFSTLEEELFEKDSPAVKMFEAITSGQIETSIKILTALKGDEEDTINMLKKFKDTSMDMFIDMIKSPNESTFSSISHGDCWSNNFLFRYDAENNPVEVMLLDLQMTKIASVAVDLNHVLFSTLQPSQNKGGLQANLADYHATYTNVMNKAGATPRFTLSELEEEFKAKNPYGYVIGLIMVPFVACEGDELIDIGDMNDETHAEQMMAQKEKQLVDIALAGGVFQQRFLALIEEIKYSGIV